MCNTGMETDSEDRRRSALPQQPRTAVSRSEELPLGSGAVGEAGAPEPDSGSARATQELCCRPGLSPRPASPSSSVQGQVRLGIVSVPFCLIPLGFQGDGCYPGETSDSAPVPRCRQLARCPWFSENPQRPASGVTADATAVEN